MKRMVLDTDVVIAGMRSPHGASAALLLAADERAVTLLASLPLAMEYEAVSMRQEHYRAAGLTREEAKVFVGAVLALVEPVEIYFLWRPQLRDADDEMVLEAAINGRADIIVTFNRKDYGDAATQFGIEVLLPAVAIKRIQR
jgi:putative PIN family toxin of toxin-antitoxin system